MAALRGFASTAPGQWMTFFGVFAICAALASAIHVSLTLAVLWWVGLLTPIGRMLACSG